MSRKETKIEDQVEMDVAEAVEETVEVSVLTEEEVEASNPPSPEEEVLYENSKGTFLLIEGKLYDSEGNRTTSSAVASNRDPLKRVVS